MPFDLPELIDAAIARQINVMRYEAHLRRRIARMIEESAVEIIARLMAAEDLTAFGKARLDALLADIVEVIATDYTGVKGVMREQLHDFAWDEARWVGVTVGAATPTKEVLARLVDDTMIQGAPSAAWWDRMSGDAQFRFKAAIRQGVIQGESNSTIVARLRRERGALGEVAVSRRNAEALVRTSIQTVASTARMDVLKLNPDVVAGVMQISTLDNRTTDICIAYDGGTWDLEGKAIRGTTLPFNGGPPRHWNCRSTLVPVTKTYKELGLDVPDRGDSNRASSDGPIAATTKFADWLAGKSATFQDDLLGRGRAELWRKGKISLQQLLDFKGRPLTLAQLRKKYE
jgi:SPP1 gp7 family putative phage head morphogenesis protein